MKRLVVVLTAAIFVALPAQAGAVGTLDQQQTTVTSAVAIVGAGSACCLPLSRAQTFTSQLSGGLDRVDLFLSQDGVSGPLTVEIRDVSGGAPGSTTLASASVPAAEIPPFGSETFVAVPFASPAPVLAGSQYAIVAFSGGADFYHWGTGGFTDLYAGGGLFGTFSSPPTTWVGPSIVDTAFKTYVKTPYEFRGFLAPVDNPPVVNAAKAGSSVPVKFSLGGDQGLGVLAVGYPSSQQYNCDSDDLIDPIEETTTANTGLTYNPFTDEYTYVWKTTKAWSGQCRKLTVGLDDYTTHTADFKLK